jgi:hypothetical protein
VQLKCIDCLQQESNHCAIHHGYDERYLKYRHAAAMMQWFAVDAWVRPACHAYSGSEVPIFDSLPAAYSKYRRRMRKDPVTLAPIELPAEASALEFFSLRPSHRDRVHSTSNPCTPAHLLLPGHATPLEHHHHHHQQSAAGTSQYWCTCSAL